MTDVLKIKVNNTWVGIPAIKGEPGEVQADLSNLSQAGKDKLYALKVHANKGEVLTDSSALADLKEYNTNSVKSGIDTIKADNYTVVGSPTITDDGVLQSPITSSNYITTGFSYDISKDFEYRFSAYITYQSGLGDKYLCGLNTSSMYAHLRFNGTTLYCVFYSQNDGIIYHSYSQSGWYDFIISKNGTTYTLKHKLSSESEYIEQTTTLTGTYISRNEELKIGTFFAYYMDYAQIDLNSFKFFDENGSLVYQPCLKIPYTQSKTGSKIVNSYYRDRVQDMYNQFGWANYYTLSDTDFTLPMGENLDGHVTKIDWYKNGATSWEYDTNLDCIETGSCTSGTAVTLPKAMADTNYSLSVPYSSKTKTGFTPSASGTYIAKGKITLG